MLATYKADYYAGRPALTVNEVGEGRVYYIASRNEDRFLDDLYGGVSETLDLRRSLEAELPEGVSAQLRSDGERETVFLMNSRTSRARVDLGDAVFMDLLTGSPVNGEVQLEGYGVMVLAR